MLSVGIAQIPNSADISKNFENICGLLEKFKKTDVDVILFPECSLSGFTSKMRECSKEALVPYILKMQNWVNQTGIEVVLPTARVENEKIFNSGYWFKENENQRFYKTGLTDSEKNFFSLPSDLSPKVFHLKNYKLAVLICFEIEHSPWTYFEKGAADAILWPGYWGWTLEDKWADKKLQGKPNQVFINMASWQMPILQSNFAYNDLDGHKGVGPEGLSFVIDQDNKHIFTGPHLEKNGFIVTLDKINNRTVVTNCRSL